MGRHPRPQLCGFGCPADRCPRTLAREGGAPRVQKEGGRATASCRQGRTRTNPVRPQRLDREGTDGDDAFLAPLPEQADHRDVAVKVKVIGAQADRLGHARARRIQQLQERTVTQADGRIVRVGDVEQAPHFLDRQGLGQVSSRAGGAQLGGGVDPDKPFRERVLV